MLLTALVAVVIRLYLWEPSADTLETAGILVGAAGLTIVFVTGYFVLWFSVLAIVELSRRFRITRR